MQSHLECHSKGSWEGRPSQLHLGGRGRKEGEGIREKEGEREGIGGKEGDRREKGSRPWVCLLSIIRERRKACGCWVASDPTVQGLV